MYNIFKKQTHISRCSIPEHSRLTSLGPPLSLHTNQPCDLQGLTRALTWWVSPERLHIKSCVPFLELLSSPPRGDQNF